MRDVFAALSSPIRREVLTLLKDGSKSAGELSAAFGVSRATMSTHFAILKEAGLIEADRDGTRILYALRLSVLEEAMAGLMDTLRLGEAAGRKEGEAT
ncbi:metalloregulator ArsR/SmtB family transcription factor [Parvularcula dongshanensis]|uniref:DNA-binding transcriptional ArsR family regulator n=1 Tax=Parvularcula dongshanensis TaxID=1173995 RepID=A0A840I107_9PROT|nr:metalloregulator ArsR/SmtB family transcription factor [Parvularcula dongshanensis]MBB4657780.1 DNA-binding transcriptional ArsR family regulator [Parvularcula dongshanensis]